MSRKRKDRGTEDDSALLARAFRDVTPLAGRKIAKRTAAAMPKTATRPARPRAPAAPPPDEVEAGAHLPALEPGAVAGLDKRTAQRLRRGRLAVEARLDLHGHTQDAAWPALVRFLADAQAKGRRCVLVITGKGLRQSDGEREAGVLRANVPRWLNQPPNRARVLAVARAAPADGGDGALYVLLKKAKGA